MTPLSFESCAQHCRSTRPYSVDNGSSVLPVNASANGAIPSSITVFAFVSTSLCCLINYSPHRDMHHKSQRWMLPPRERSLDKESIVQTDSLASFLCCSLDLHQQSNLPHITGLSCLCCCPRLETIHRQHHLEWKGIHILCHMEGSPVEMCSQALGIYEICSSRR